MLRIFSRIRKSLLESSAIRTPVLSRVERYLIYAIGEILLVMIGILLALQVNNWNEDKHLRILEREYYKNLLTTLRKDSIELVKIIDFQSKSLENQLKIISHSFEQLNKSKSEEDFNQCLLQITAGNYSFFPKYGTYNTILSATGIDIFKSQEVKSLLIDLYDYQCKRYENMDKIIDQKFAFEMQPYLNKELGFSDQDFEILSRTTIRQIEENYEDLVVHCRDVYGWLLTCNRQLIQIQKSVSNLISLIQLELNKK